MKNLFLISTLSLCLLSGCVKVPKNLLKPSGETLKLREAQSRTFDTYSDKQLIRASISVLQDMGYTIKESSSEYGVLTAVKEASAVSAGQVLGNVAMAVFCGETTPIDKTQFITATMVILDKSEQGKAVARTTFQRVIVRTDDSQYAQTVTDPNVYQDFYEKLDKALFLEVNKL